MAQHDYVIDNASGATVRADINSALSAIQSLNSGSSAPSSTVAGMLWLDTTGGAPYALKVRYAGNNHWLTLASVTDPGSDGNIETSATIKGTIDSTASFPAGIVLQVKGDQVREQNSLGQGYTNYYEVNITLKSASSDIYIFHGHGVNIQGTNEGYGIKVYRNTSATVTTSHTLVYSPSVTDATGPLTGYMSAGNAFHRYSYQFKDSLSGFSAGNTLYYGFFFRKRSSNASVTVPSGDNNGQHAVFDTTIMEVQK